MLAEKNDEGVNMSEELREATKDDSLSFFLKEIRYDGEKYTVSPVKSSFLMPELYEYIPNEELFGVYEE